MLYSAIAQVSLVALVAVTLFVLWAGGRWARLSAVLHAANWALVSLLQQRHERARFFQTGDFVVDLIGEALAIAIAVAARRSWSAGIAAFQLLGLVNYIIILVDHRVHRRAFWTAAYLWEAGDLICLILAGLEGLRAARSARRAVAGPADPGA